MAGTDPYDPVSMIIITEMANSNQLVVWNSVEGIRYQVLATTNLTFPFQPISPVSSATGSSSFFFDAARAATNKFYRIQVVP